MSKTRTALPPIVSREEWLVARKKLLAKEKKATRMRDAVSAERRRLPMVKVEKKYAFEGPNGKLAFADLFEGRRQLYVHHFMWVDERNAGCPSCTMAADLGFNAAHRAHLHARDITFACISRAPYSSIAAYKEAHGWDFPWYSSFGTDFNYDLHATLDESKAPIEFNYRDKQQLLKAGLKEEMLKGDWPVNSVFVRDGKTVYHAYSASARGLDQLFMPHNFLDLTPYGRQQDWEDSPPGWPQKATYG